MHLLSRVYIAKIPARLATTYIRICYGFSYLTHPIRNVGCWLLCVWPHPTCIDGAIACKRQRTRKRYSRGRLETRRTPGKGRYRGVFGMGYVASRDFDSVDSELYLYMKHNISISAATVSSSSARRLYLWAMCWTSIKHKHTSRASTQIVSQLGGNAAKEYIYVWKLL